MTQGFQTLSSLLFFGAIGLLVRGLRDRSKLADSLKWSASLFGMSLIFRGFSEMSVMNFLFGGAMVYFAQKNNLEWRDILQEKLGTFLDLVQAQRTSGGDSKSHMSRTVENVLEAQQKLKAAVRPGNESHKSASPAGVVKELLKKKAEPSRFDTDSENLIIPPELAPYRQRDPIVEEILKRVK